MSPENILPTLAEMSITLAGFSGLIVSVRPGRREPWTSDQLLRVLGAISASMANRMTHVLLLETAVMIVPPVIELVSRPCGAELLPVCPSV